MTTLAEHPEQSTSQSERRIPIKYRNVGPRERQLSTIAGGALALVGLRHGGLGGLALAGLGTVVAYRGVTGHCPAYSALGVDTNDRAPKPEEYFDRGIHVEQSFTIGKPRAELFRYWRDFENLPTFMSHLESVQVIDDKRSRWTAHGPAKVNVSWEAEIINEEADALIAWRSLGGADVDNSGSVRFVDAPGDRGTEVRVVVDYIPPAGRVGKYIAMLFGEAPEQTIKEDLRNFKRLMETGTIPTTTGQPRGTCSRWRDEGERQESTY